ncbi:MAG TPA: discoidin domain-containing protein, partial [Polyangiaceae bacterium]|nr:discoidin domain-containing protein [Polyangiaceae bacterium]
MKHFLLCVGFATSLLTACGPAQESDELTELDTLETSSAIKLTGTATASSVQSSTLGPEKAVDGNTGTRWSSAFSDPQWIRIDLGSVKTINRVVLRWEAAYSSNYEIQFSNDAANWTRAYGDAAGNGGIDDIAVTGSARYVRMYSTKRGTGYGNSLWEFEVHAPDVAPPPPPPPPPPAAAVALPAKIEAEKYVRFHDTTAGNSGTASCSSTNVDAQTTTDPKGGVCNIAYVVAGEWLEYDVSVASTASFDITARLASNTTGKTVHVEIDGVNVTGALAAPSAGWQAFSDVVKRGVSIAAGNHKLRLVMDTGSTNVN